MLAPVGGNDDKYAQILVLGIQDFFPVVFPVPALHRTSAFEDKRDTVGDTVQGIPQIVPKKPSGDCSAGTSQDMELAVWVLLCVRELKG